MIQEYFSNFVSCVGYKSYGGSAMHHDTYMKREMVERIKINFTDEEKISE